MLGLKAATATLEASLIQAKGEIESELSDYGLRYWRSVYPTLRYQLELSAHLLEHALEGEQQHHTLLDFGAGLGFTSLLAVQLGVKKVYYLDRYAPVCEDAQKIARILDLKASKYINKTFKAAILEVQDTTSLVSRDVIEHIYDLEDFFNDTHELTHLNRMVHNTSANIYNVLLKSYFNEVHDKAENQTVRDTSEIKLGEADTGFFHRRKAYISSKEIGFSENEIEQMAKRTRGMTLADIDQAIDLYLQSKEMPEIPAHPTNTCDPDTGNWAERLLTFQEYRDAAMGYTLQFLPGFYNAHHSNPIKRNSLRLANALLRKNWLSPKLWPSITIIGTSDLATDS